MCESRPYLFIASWGRYWLFRHDDAEWLTDSYVAWRTSYVHLPPDTLPGSHLLLDLPADGAVEFERVEGVFRFTRTTTKFTAKIAERLAVEGKPIEPSNWCLNTKGHAVWSREGRPVLLNADVARELLNRDGVTFDQAGDLAPIRVFHEGELIGAVQPVAPYGLPELPVQGVSDG